MFSLTVRWPGGRLNVAGLAFTYADRLARVLSTTLPLARFWIHGRTLTVTRMVSLVVFLTVTEPMLPFFAVFSTTAGVIETPPCWATRAAGAESSARAITAPVAVPATARPRAPAASRVLARFTSGISLFLFWVV